jgi:hypothetical protein
MPVPSVADARDAPVLRDQEQFGRLGMAWPV